ncbi:type III secretion system export apparatus subunit SctR [Erwinia psidii]|uniref:EscR/YscR/HrcR family type III secretion system export apparatus protein n=1 Tax=Erwinia psidii TaxID=69224 RepID=A0A3N6V461_9GAMM|nr:type III secretion system export apparatus subunit SctR [Erwinia psidii]MCX8961520.1 EscR/YscR/HrcR family type III secretion system export apparatus protein [Erwinia psidii]RQM39905.1 EscR/YscR/HrcR family type III secretion system export apparatus protein [Erwinia psidii]
MDIQNIDPHILAIFVGAISLLPLFIIICTSFLKISVVLLIVRNALGIQQVPANMVIYSISLAATIFIMMPVFNETCRRIEDVSQGEMNIEAIYSNRERIIEPLQNFFLHNINPDTQIRLTKAAKKLWQKNAEDPVDHNNLAIILSSFVLSELQAGFKTGFLIYIPFLVVDLLVANILMALGMQMVAPMVVSLPLKLLLFTLIDGWSRLLEGLFYSYL